MQSLNRILTSKDIAKEISVEPVTVRKYAQALEDKGYTFLKNDRDWRVYKESDIKALEYFKVLRESNYSVEDCAERVATLYRENLAIADTDIAIQKRNLNKFEAFKEQQESFNKELINRLEKQQNYFEGRLEERDQKLIEVLREVQDTKKLIAAAEEKKKPWWKLW